jgi:hexosaminidase
VYAFLDRFLGEMAGLFPDAYLHIGGDEVTPRQWNANDDILDYMYRHDLRDLQALQAHFNGRVNAILRKHGKRMVGWDEVLAPGLPKDVLIHSWRGPESLAEAAKQGYQGILSNGYYLDLNLHASEHYASDPIPPGSTLTPEQRARILGGEATMWSEFLDPVVLQSRLWPRALAVAERLWSPADVRDVEDMYRRLGVQSARMDAVGATHNTGYVPALQALVPGQPVAPLKVLADVVEPVKRYQRGTLKAYVQSMPLDRLVDAARPESLVAREFARDVGRFIAAPTGSRDPAPLRASLERWRDNHAVLEPILTSSRKAWEVRPLSKDLTRLANLGLEALDAVSGGARRDEAWLAQANRTVQQVYAPRGALQIALAPAVCRLAYAAAGHAPPEHCPPRPEPAH